MKNNMRKIFYFVLLLLFQFLFVMVMILDKERTLATGREVTFRVVPVDPRSLFRGDYVILNYSFSRISRSRFRTDGKGRIRLRERVYVKLERKAGIWTAVAAQRRPFIDLERGRIMLRGYVGKSFSRMLQVEYGIESFFVPEGRGKKIESDLVKNRVRVKVAVGKKGRAVIKGLLIDGRPVVF